MKNFFKRMYFLFTADEALDSLIIERDREIRRKKFQENAHRLNLCYKHRQEKNHSHYSSKNCHHCQLEKQLIHARKIILRYENDYDIIEE